MTRYQVQYSGRLRHRDTQEPAPRDHVEYFADHLAAALEEDGAEDIDVSSNLRTAEVSVSISLTAPDLRTAQELGSAMLARAAAETGARTTDPPDVADASDVDWDSARTYRDGELVPA